MAFSLDLGCVYIFPVVGRDIAWDLQVETGNEDAFTLIDCVDMGKNN